MEYQNPFVEVDSHMSQSAISAYMTRVFGWMTLALTITAITSLLVASSPLLGIIAGNRILFFGLIIGELLLVGALAGMVNKMSSILATAIFVGYAILNGLTLSIIFLMYTGSDIALCFFITAGTFAFMSAYGYFTQKDLTSVGNFMIMALVGIFIASIANFFMQSQALYWIISYAGVFIFIGLTAYDTQKIKNQALMLSGNSETMQKGAIMGALTLYLDFINLFIFILRIFGGRK
jgi:FtsH-binding integral membrane protein